MTPRLGNVFTVREADDDKMGKVLQFRRPEPKSPTAHNVSRVPLSHVFKGKPSYTLLKNDYKKETFQWGELRKIVVGISYTVVIDDKAWWRIRGLKLGQKHEFVDETGSKWMIERGADGEVHPDAKVQSVAPIFYLKRDGREIAIGFWDEMTRALS